LFGPPDKKQNFSFVPEKKGKENSKIDEKLKKWKFYMQIESGTKELSMSSFKTGRCTSMMEMK